MQYTLFPHSQKASAGAAFLVILSPAIGTGPFLACPPSSTNVSCSCHAKLLQTHCSLHLRHTSKLSIKSPVGVSISQLATAPKKACPTIVYVPNSTAPLSHDFPCTNLPRNNVSVHAWLRCVPAVHACFCFVCVCLCLCVCKCVRLHAQLRACVRACVCGYICVCVSMHASPLPQTLTCNLRAHSALQNSVAFPMGCKQGRNVCLILGPTSSSSPTSHALRPSA